MGPSRTALALAVVLAAACGDDAVVSGTTKDSAAPDVAVTSDAASEAESGRSERDVSSVDEPATDGGLPDRELEAIEAANDASLADATTDRTGDAAGDTGDASAVVEPVHYYGRWNRLADRAITVNSGSHVVAQFAGSSLAARFDVSANGMPLPTIAWRIDQGPWQESNVAASVTLAQTLTGETHQVWLMARGLDERQSRWTPPLSASLTFLEFDVTGGAVQPSPRPSQRKVEFLGDSITEGVAVFSDRPPNMTGATWRADGRVAYACQTALALDADWRQVGFGRQGVTIVGNGGVPPAGQAFDWIYAGVPRDAWQPDLVVINQGTNDGGAASDVFRPAYASFLATVRKGYAKASIAALRPFGGAHAADIQAEVSARIAGGDTHIFFVDTTGWLSSADFTDGVHPNAQGSAKAAQLLVTELGKHPW